MSTPFNRLMKQEGIPDEVQRTFNAYYSKLAKGEKGMLPESTVRPPSPQNLVDYHQVTDLASSKYLKSTLVIKLNGGLGTSMGLSKAKSLLPVKGNLNFLVVT